MTLLGYTHTLTHTHTHTHTSEKGEHFGVCDNAFARTQRIVCKVISPLSKQQPKLQRSKRLNETERERGHKHKATAPQGQITPI